MADIQPNKKTSEETAAGTMLSTDLFRIVQGTGTDLDPYVSRRATLADLAAYLGASTAGVQSIVAGSGVTVDSTDPAHPIVSAAGSMWPFPDGCVAWFSVVHRAGINGLPVNYMNMPIDGPPRGCLATATSTATVFDSTGAVASGGQFTTAPSPYCTETTIFAVIVTPASITSGQFSTIVSGATGALQMRLGNLSGAAIALQSNKTSVANVGDDSAAGTMTPNTKYLLALTMHAGAWTMRRNGVQTASGTTANTPTVANNTIGYSVNPGQEAATHKLLEVVYFDHLLNSTDMAAAEAYLKARHSIP